MLNNSEESCSVKVPMFVGLVLCGISILFVTHHKIILHDSKDYFNSPMTETEKKEMINLLENFTNMLHASKIEYFIHFGTLIGSVRHHGLIPWDDDIDIYVDTSQKAKLVQNLELLKPAYSFYSVSDILAPYGQWKFYKTNSSRSFVHRAFKFPYIDIWFYTSNATHVYHEILPEEGILKTDLYPLINRPFDRLNLAAPCNSTVVLKFANIKQCKNRSYSHVLEVPLCNWWQRVVACEKLFSKYSFVFYETSQGPRPYFMNSNKMGSQRELLQIRNVVISNRTIFQPRCSGQRKLL